ncbi:hypothetical protein [Roseimaritima sediminicola]|uniref:hypothetical protein n=1 Tax=Roseimaritima sediminicola TaxID=2662066 RepID=UPI0012984875|nr:hypothetical protein [Roseimaritima sediminicola]
MHCDLDSTVPEWIIEYPQTEGLFRRLELEMHCGGKSLRYVCQQRGLDPLEVLGGLRAAVRSDDSAADDDAAQ